MKVACESGIGTIPPSLTKEGPSESSTNDGSETPPASQKGQKPLFAAWEVFKKNGGIQDQIPSGSECRETDKKAEYNPVTRSSCDNSEDRADEQRHVERGATSNNVSSKTPEQGSDQHSNINRNGQAIVVRGVQLSSG